MPTCPTCGAALEEGARFCPHDGTPVEDETPTAVEVEVRRMTLRGAAVAPAVAAPGAPAAPTAGAAPAAAPAPLGIVKVTPLPPPTVPPAALAPPPVAPFAATPPPAASAVPLPVGPLGPVVAVTPAGSPAPRLADHATDRDPFHQDEPSGPTETHDVVPPAGPGELVDKVIDNRYHIIERISAGSVGVVYRGEHIQIRRPIAVKVLHHAYTERDDYLVRFEREALAASKMSHPACVSVLDFGTFEGRPYMVMEYVEGRPLSEVLAEGPLPLPDAVLLTRVILGALRHAHKLGIIHRDIKPANIMLCDPGRTGAQLKVLDFGLAKSLDTEDRAGQHVTLAGTICGTPGYLSPEQAAGMPLDARSDLYSVGAVLFTLVCGRRPFVYGELAREIRAHVCETPPPIRSLRPEASAELEAVVARALEKNPADRFQDADDFIAALAQVPEARGTYAAAPLDLLPVTTVAAGQSGAALPARTVPSPPPTMPPPTAMPPPTPAPPLARPDLHAAETVLRSAPTMLLSGASARDVADPAWTRGPVALAPGGGPAAGAPPAAPATPSQSLTTVPTTGRGKLVAGLILVVAVILASILGWYFTR
jgi:serine/threonine-protein kinase